MVGTALQASKEADLAGPGIGDYAELERVLPTDYHSLLTPRETQQAIFAVKGYIEAELCRELNLMMVQVPLIVDAESGVNDMLDRDGSRTPITFHIANDHDQHPIDAQVVQAATKWKRVALRAVRDGRRARACAPTCGPSARTTSSTTTTASTSTSGTGSGSSPPTSATSTT